MQEIAIIVRCECGWTKWQRGENEYHMRKVLDKLKRHHVQDAHKGEDHVRFRTNKTTDLLNRF